MEGDEKGYERGGRRKLSDMEDSPGKKVVSETTGKIWIKVKIGICLHIFSPASS